jgi:hypothetical protein
MNLSLIIRNMFPNALDNVTPGFKEQAGCISYMRQKDNIYNNRVYRDKCHNNIRVLITLLKSYKIKDKYKMN